MEQVGGLCEGLPNRGSELLGPPMAEQRRRMADSELCHFLGDAAYVSLSPEAYTLGPQGVQKGDAEGSILSCLKRL